MPLASELGLPIPDVDDEGNNPIYPPRLSMELAKSSAAACRKCGTKFAKGDPRMALSFNSYSGHSGGEGYWYDSTTTYFFKVKCGIDKFKQHFTVSEIGGLNSMPKKEQDMVKKAFPKALPKAKAKASPKKAAASPKKGVKKDMPLKGEEDKAGGLDLSKMETVLRDWFNAKKEAAEAEKIIEACKTKVEAEMAKTGLTSLQTPSLTVDKRMQSRESVSKQDMPAEVFAKYAKVSSFAVFSLKEKK